MEEQVHKALERAYFFLKFRPRTKKEVQNYLEKKAKRFRWPSAVVTSTIHELEELDLVNDNKFISWFVEQRNSTRQKSQFALRSELLRLGVPKDLIEEYFSESPVEEESLVLEALKRKWSRFQRLDKRERFQKAAAFLSRRGFSFDLIKKAIKTLEEGENNLVQ